MITLKTKIGNSVLELEFEGQQDMLKKGAFWTQLPQECNLCKGKELSLFFRTTKDGDDYYGLKCTCGADLTFHQYKKGGFYITKEDTFKIWEGKVQDTSQPTNTQPVNNEEIPF